jgi:hypothetical protein
MIAVFSFLDQAKLFEFILLYFILNNTLTQLDFPNIYCVMVPYYCKM